MSKKAKITLLSISLAIILLILIIVVKLINNGFKISTYSTENYLEDQLEEFLYNESGQEYKNRVITIGKREYEDCTLVVYEVDGDENIIVDYENEGKFGKYDVFNLKRIIKSDKSVAMIDIYDNSRRKYIILSSLDHNEFSSINIVNKSTDKILDEIYLEDISKEDFKIEKLNDKSTILEYIPKADVELRLELNKKSGY